VVPPFGATHPEEPPARTISSQAQALLAAGGTDLGDHPERDGGSRSVTGPAAPERLVLAGLGALGEIFADEGDAGEGPAGEDQVYSHE
jgi:hypothetical protein